MEEGREETKDHMLLIQEQWEDNRAGMLEVLLMEEHMLHIRKRWQMVEVGMMGATGAGSDRREFLSAQLQIHSMMVMYKHRNSLHLHDLFVYV